MDDDRDLPTAASAAAPTDIRVELSAPRRVYRSREDRIFGGVCTGIARAGGASFIGYALAMFLLPGEPRTERTDVEPDGDPLVVWGGFALLVLGSFLASRLDLFHLDLLTPSVGAVGPAALLVLAATIVGRRKRAGRLASGGFTRPVRDRLVFGVASGFARYADVDTNVVRVVLGIIGVWTNGLAILLYALLAVFLPTDDA